MLAAWSLWPVAFFNLLSIAINFCHSMCQLSPTVFSSAPLLRSFSTFPKLDFLLPPKENYQPANAAWPSPDMNRPWPGSYPPVASKICQPSPGKKRNQCSGQKGFHCTACNLSCYKIFPPVGILLPPHIHLEPH